MANRFASNAHAHSFCDRCGFRAPLRKLTHTYILGKRQEIKVCSACRDENNGDHPQYWVGIIGAQKAADDPQALRNPRPDTNLNESRGLFAWNPVASQQVNTTINSVKIEVS